MVDTIVVIAGQLAIVGQDHGKDNDESAENDCSAHREVLTLVAIWARGADCKGKDRKAISKEKNCP